MSDLLRRFASSPLQGEHTRSPAESALRRVLEARVQTLVDFYRHVQTTRMQGVPLLNPALCVEAVGFEWAAGAGEGEDAVAEGILITPWFMSLVRLPADPTARAERVGRKAVRDFGSERFEFIGASDPAVGYHETCALFSPMGHFRRQAQARETAEASLALTRPVAAEALPPAVPAQPAQPSRRAFFLPRSSRGAA